MATMWLALGGEALLMTAVAAAAVKWVRSTANTASEQAELG